MRNKLKAFIKTGGYSLIELAIVLVIIGAISAPAIALYQQNKLEKDYTKTGTTISTTLSAIGDFRAAYGRYPCPAPPDAASGDANYGLEDCTSASSTPSARAGMSNVLVGSLPFKSMNLQEPETYDAYGYRLTYVVTADLAVSNTFNPANGGITIIDKEGNHILNPQDSGQFMVLSHGHNGVGGYTRFGTLRAPCTGDAAEIENCDDDNVFVIDALDNSYDDRGGYFASEQLTEWQLEGTNSSNIFLKGDTNGDRNIAIGVFTSEDLTNAETSAIRTLTSDSGGITANNHSFQSDNLCEFGETTSNGDCFDHELIMDDHTAGTGLICPTNTPYLIGISDTKEPVCTDSITIGCPDGMFMSGLNANKEPICRGTPPAGCAGQTVAATCGDSRTLDSHIHGEHQFVYSGQCYTFPTSHDSAYFASLISGKTTGEINTLISDLNNNTTREQSSCGDSASNALVRDSYYCNNGNWEFVRAHERLTAAYPSFPASYDHNNHTQNAENNHTYSQTFDVLNNTSQHDCWCREDYRYTTPSCPYGMAGTGKRVQKYRCPQTNSSSKAYVTVYEDFSGCSCTPTTLDSTQSCISYYNSQNGTSAPHYGLTGNVTLKHNYTCNGLGQLVRQDPPISVDVSQCACPSRDPIINRTACSPIGTTNSFSWTFDSTTYNETNVASITTNTFNCPNTTDGNGIPTPGSYLGAVSVSGIPACTCDNSYYEDREESCPNDEDEGSIVKRYIQNCTTGEMEDSGMTVSSNCNGCKWNAGNIGEDSNSKLGGSSKEVGKKCACGLSPTAVCWADGGSSKAYKTYTNCACVIDLE